MGIRRRKERSVFAFCSPMAILRIYRFVVKSTVRTVAAKENVLFVQSRNVRFHGWPRTPWKRSESLFGDALCSQVGAAYYGSTAEGTQCPSPTRARTAPGRNLACARGPQSGSGPHRQLGRKSLGSTAGSKGGMIKTCRLACYDQVRRVAARGRSCRSDQEPPLTIRSVVGTQPVTNG